MGPYFNPRRGLLGLLIACCRSHHTVGPLVTAAASNRWTVQRCLTHCAKAKLAWPPHQLEAQPERGLAVSLHRAYASSFMAMIRTSVGGVVRCQPQDPHAVVKMGAATGWWLLFHAKLEGQSRSAMRLFALLHRLDSITHQQHVKLQADRCNMVSVLQAQPAQTPASTKRRRGATHGWRLLQPTATQQAYRTRLRQNLCGPQPNKHPALARQAQRPNSCLPTTFRHQLECCHPS